MEIKIVKTESELMEFIKFPWKIYKNDPNWVPQLIDDYKFTLTENPFWEHAEKELYLAYDENGRCIGRIAAVTDQNFIKFHNEKTGFFGFYESINDHNAAKALFDKAIVWLRSKGMQKMIGPTNPSTNDEMGFLCSGFDTPPRLMMPYNPDYYLYLAEKSGLSKAKELYAYDMDVSGENLERLERLSQIAYKKNPGLKVRKLNIKDFENEIARAVEIYNAAWEKNWGFVPWTQKEFYTIAKRLKDLLLLDTTLLAEIDGKPVAMLIAVPDYNFVMKKMNGNLWPLGIFKFLYYKNKINALRLMIMGVVKENRQRGIEGVLYNESLKNSLRLGFKKCEFSWILEDNIMTQRACEMMGGKLYKKYRVYQTSV
ncbi:MAG: hypothetical protein LHV68_11270 [Elusimicrobia bacterium]|nr:hypothetical protein [Candidatus Liberimonas magnetica]